MDNGPRRIGGNVSDRSEERVAGGDSAVSSETRTTGKLAPTVEAASSSRTAAAASRAIAKVKLQSRQMNPIRTGGSLGERGTSAYPARMTASSITASIGPLDHEPDAPRNAISSLPPVVAASCARRRSPRPTPARSSNPLCRRRGLPTAMQRRATRAVARCGPVPSRPPRKTPSAQALASLLLVPAYHFTGSAAIPGIRGHGGKITPGRDESVGKCDPHHVCPPGPFHQTRASI